MSEFLHRLAEGLRTREKLLEDHSEHSAFDNPHEGGALKIEYQSLLDEIRGFRTKIEKAQKAKKDFDEHFEREIDNDNRKLLVKLDAWKRTFPGDV